MSDEGIDEGDDGAAVAAEDVGDAAIDEALHHVVRHGEVPDRVVGLGGQHLGRGAEGACWGTNGGGGGGMGGRGPDTFERQGNKTM